MWYEDSKPGVVMSHDTFLEYFSVRQRKDPWRKIGEYEVLTKNASFTLEIYSDSSRTEFIGQFDGHTPGTLAPIGPGERYPEMKLIKEEHLRGSDEEDVITNCKQRKTELGGQITHFIERKAWEN